MMKIYIQMGDFEMYMDIKDNKLIIEVEHTPWECQGEAVFTIPLTDEQVKSLKNLQYDYYKD